jgi:GNAT superfamily N-acetyltransferase
VAEPFFLRAATAAEIEGTFEEWGELVVTPERSYRATDVEGAVLVLSSGEIGAAVTWCLEGGGVAEITTLNALVAGRGFGRAALHYAEDELRRRGVTRLKLFTANPNVGAIALYLREGWRVVRIHLDAMDAVRALKPGVPAEEHGLPLRDMWELVKEL